MVDDGVLVVWLHFGFVGCGVWWRWMFDVSGCFLESKIRIDFDEL